jgi:hypothetical protein
MNLAYATELSLEPYQLFESLLTPPNSIVDLAVLT